MLNEAPLKEVYEQAKQQVYQEINNRPEPIQLSETAKKKLSEKLPLCVAHILTKSPAKSEKTNFNKLVMSLVTYFQMAGWNEQEAWNRVQSFIEGYPHSETYGTSEKRKKHWDDEWNYLKNNPDYSFSCSFIKGLGLPGNAFDCSSCINGSHEKERAPSSLSSKEVLAALRANEDGDADLYIKRFKDLYCYDHTENRWYCREPDGHWFLDKVGEAVTGVKKIIDIYGVEIKRQNNQMINAEKKGNSKEAEKARINIDELRSRIRKLQSKYRKANVIYLAACGDGSLGITGEEWDSDPWLLGCANGILDLRTGELKPIDPNAYIKTVAPTEWKGLNAACPVWEKFLVEIYKSNTELRNFIQRLFGYAMIGEVSEDIFPIFWGSDGRNGKDTKFETIRFVLGEYASPIDSELLLAQRFNKRAGTATPELKDLKGKRISWASETEEGRKFDVAKIKYFTGGGTIVARGLYDRRVLTFEPSHTLFLITNPKPRAKGDDAAFWERVFLIPLTQRFIENPNPKN